MSLTEICILNFLFNPDEIQDLNEIFIKINEEVEKKYQMDNN